MENEKKVIVIHNCTGHGLEPERVARFCTRFPFPKHLWRFSSLITGSRTFDETLTVAGPETIDINCLPGVDEIGVYDSTHELYELVVKRTTAYSWEELEPKILELLYKRHDRLSELESIN